MKRSGINDEIWDLVDGFDQRMDARRGLARAIAHMGQIEKQNKEILAAYKQLVNILTQAGKEGQTTFKFSLKREEDNGMPSDGANEGAGRA